MRAIRAQLANECDLCLQRLLDADAAKVSGPLFHRKRSMLARSHDCARRGAMRSFDQHVRRRLLFALICIGGACSACVPAYQPPATTVPYALVKVRSIFHHAPSNYGESRHLRIDIDDENWVSRIETVDRQRWQIPWARAVRARPGLRRWSFRVAFSHNETRIEEKTEDVDVPYTETETYTDFGVTKTRTVTKYRRETKHVTKSVDVTVNDDSCSLEVGQSFQDQRVYLLQYTYVGSGICRLTCLEQFVPQPGVAPQFRPCSG
jgi:hypothetical protein